MGPQQRTRIHLSKWRGLMVKLVCLWPSRNLIRPEVEKLCAQLQKIDSGGRYHLKMSIVMLYQFVFLFFIELNHNFERRDVLFHAAQKIDSFSDQS
jgi:hypothetical protein